MTISQTLILKVAMHPGITEVQLQESYPELNILSIRNVLVVLVDLKALTRVWDTAHGTYSTVSGPEEGYWLTEFTPHLVGVAFGRPKKQKMTCESCGTVTKVNPFTGLAKMKLCNSCNKPLIQPRLKQ